MAKSRIPGILEILPILYFEVFKYELNLDLQICKKTVELKQCFGVFLCSLHPLFLVEPRQYDLMELHEGFVITQ
jgi:hypothetical protein